MNHDLDKAIDTSIEKHVNGYLREMTGKLDAHIQKHDEFLEEVKPILQAYQGGKLLGEILKWIAGVGVAILTIKGVFLNK